MAYDLTGVDSTNTWYDFVIELNLITNPEYLVMGLFIYSLWIILFASTRGATGDTVLALLFSSTMVTLIGIFLVFAKLISFAWVSIPLILMIASFIIFFTVGGN